MSRRRIVVYTTVDIDDIGPAERERLVKVISGTFQPLYGEQGSKRFDLIHYKEENRLRLLVNALRYSASGSVDIPS